MSTRKLSGAQRRKLCKEEKQKSEELLRKVPKLETFFKSSLDLEDANVNLQDVGDTLNGIYLGIFRFFIS